eukprot:767860-Hanusia_phi.AAC.1
MERRIVARSQGLTQGGIRSSDSFSEIAFRALNISTTTRMERETVLGLLSSMTWQSNPLAKLSQVHLRPALVHGLPPDESHDARDPDVGADDDVAHEDPSREKLLVSLARLLGHDVCLRRVEGQSCGGKPVRDQVDPEQRHGHEDLGDAEDDSEEDTDDLADVGGDEVADERLGVVVDRAPLLDRSHDGREVVVSQHHLRRPLRHCRPRPHRHSDVCCMQCRSIVHAVASHRRHLPWPSFRLPRLQALDDDLLVDRLRAGEETCSHHSLQLLPPAHPCKLGASEGLATDILALEKRTDQRKQIGDGGVTREGRGGEQDKARGTGASGGVREYRLKHADHPADGFSSLLVVSGDDNDSDPSLLARHDRVSHLLARRIADADDSDKRHVALHTGKGLGVCKPLV